MLSSLWSICRHGWKKCTKNNRGRPSLCFTKPMQSGLEAGKRMNAKFKRALNFDGINWGMENYVRFFR